MCVMFQKGLLNLTGTATIRQISQFIAVFSTFPISGRHDVIHMNVLNIYIRPAYAIDKLL